MAEYIERDGICERVIRKKAQVVDYWLIENAVDDFLRGYNEAVNDVIENADTSSAADVVEVVRCKDCKYRQEPTVCPMCHEEFHFDEDDGGDYYIVDNTEDCGFCHAGERRGNNAVD